MALVTSLRRISSTLVQKFGGTVTYRQVAGGAYSTSTGTIAETETDTVIKGVLDVVSRNEVNELIQESDKKLTVAAADIQLIPSTADRIVISAVVHQIIKVEQIEQDNTAIAYTLYLRN